MKFVTWKCNKWNPTLPNWDTDGANQEAAVAEGVWGRVCRGDGERSPLELCCPCAGTAWENGTQKSPVLTVWLCCVYFSSSSLQRNILLSLHLLEGEAHGRPQLSINRLHSPTCGVEVTKWSAFIWKDKIQKANVTPSLHNNFENLRPPPKGGVALSVFAWEVEVLSRGFGMLGLARQSTAQSCHEQPCTALPELLSLKGTLLFCAAQRGDNAWSNPCPTEDFCHPGVYRKAPHPRPKLTPIWWKPTNLTQASSSQTHSCFQCRVCRCFSCISGMQKLFDMFLLKCLGKVCLLDSLALSHWFGGRQNSVPGIQ